MIRTPQAAGRAQRLPFLAFLAGSLVSLSGNAITTIAIPWFVLVTTGSPAKMGLVAFFQVVPNVLASVFGGALVDRLSYKWISIVSDLLSAVTVAAIPLFHTTVGLPFWLLLVFVFCGAALDAPGNTARLAMVPNLAKVSGVSVERANAALQSVSGLGGLVGPILAGVIVAWVGASEALWLDALTFLWSASLMALAVPDLGARAASTGRFVHDVLEGLGVLVRSRLLFALLVLAATLNFVSVPLFTVVLPVLARDAYGGPSNLGFLIAAVGAGSFTGSLVFAAIGPRLPRGRLLSLLVGAAALALIPLSFLPPFLVVFLTLMTFGFAIGTSGPLFLTIYQEHVPEEFRGRVFGSIGACLSMIAPLGLLAAGWSIGVVGVRPVLVTAATIHVVATLALLFAPAFRELDRLPAGN
ncbi:MAG: hypothetical protein QOF01_119 [Thermomicrobiales bacterium]|nr:hypothetical protein [Thermomicrobiales bacterium]MEA2593650.1 hypothetical protein [Thermomicrobiales bacterium]